MNRPYTETPITLADDVVELPQDDWYQFEPSAQDDDDDRVADCPHCSAELHQDDNWEVCPHCGLEYGW